MNTAPCNNCKILRKKKKEIQRKLWAMHDKVDNLNQKITSNQKDWINTFEQLSQRPVMVETGKIILLIDYKLKEIKIDIYSNLLHLTYYSYRYSKPVTKRMNLQSWTKPVNKTRRYVHFCSIFINTCASRHLGPLSPRNNVALMGL